MNWNLFEYNYKDILRGAWDIKKYLAKFRDVSFLGLDNNVMNFQSIGEGGKVWKQKVKLVDLDKSLDLEGIALKDKANLAISGDLEIYCNCPSFLYHGFAYIATKLEYILPGHEENRFPHIRNKNLEGTSCKHLIVVLNALPFYQSILANRLKDRVKEAPADE